MKENDRRMNAVLRKIRTLEKIISRSRILVFRWKADQHFTLEYAAGNIPAVGYTVEDFMDGEVTWPGITHPEDVPRLLRELEEHTREKRKYFEMTYRILAKNGEIRWMHDQTAALYRKSVVTHYESVIEDITEKIRTQATIRAQEEKLSALFKTAPICIGFLSGSRIEEFNDSLPELTLYSPEEIRGMSFEHLFKNRKIFAVNDEYIRNKLERDHSAGVETQWVRKDGMTVDVMLNVSRLVLDGAYLGNIFTALDISRLKKLERDLKKQTVTDFLTGISNRRAIIQRLNHDITKAHREESFLFLLLIDIDHFKSINDNFGHRTGDLVLRECVRRIRTKLRTYDIFGRYGGEEFLVTLAGSSLKTAVEVAERIRSEIASTPFAIGTYRINLTISIGIAMFESSDTIDSLLDKADVAMYEAKKNGRNRVEVFGQHDDPS